MTYMLVHGLGQNATSWQKVIDSLKIDSEKIVSPDLFRFIETGKMDYRNLYYNFFDYCENEDGPVDLGGLSLGAILSLNYALDRPEKVNSLILINTQYKMPQFLLSVQSAIFQFFPNYVFEKMGLSKKDAIQLMKSMRKLDFSLRLSEISCKTLILCGEKDKLNKKAAKQLSNLIMDAKLEFIQNAGHEANSDNPEGTAQIIKNFWVENT
ncbi:MULTISPECIES: alpha/beta hydrolase [Clostridia]|uniref:alpha/beta fold hydrolase n=1 Tax=Clostridia TaxID=186801 RepID=UPI000EA21442|nr:MULTISPECIES: alpha/beta hydrolase [Clostridia]NBJ71521.1 alpha/beta hydrolase [Roseburia sp. 1XD42-34]RKI74271.1 alpha/beta hydrolase [Clostridium sp. 1xD42-85]